MWEEVRIKKMVIAPDLLKVEAIASMVERQAIEMVPKVITECIPVSEIASI